MRGDRVSMIEDELVHHCGDGHEGDFTVYDRKPNGYELAVCDHCGARYDVVRGPVQIVAEVGEFPRWETTVTLVPKTEAG